LRNAGASDGVTVARLAIKHALSAYDAAYLHLALREHAPLATLDKKLAAAAEAEGVIVLGPLRAS
jgi:predicted nucleic acid-binding protein